MSDTVGGDIAAGAAIGSVVPVVGTAIGGVLGGAFGVLRETGLLDSLGKHLFGDAGEDVAKQVLAITAAATGGQTTAAAIASLSPDRQVELQVQLAHIAAQREAVVLAAHQAASAAAVEAFKASLADVDSARRMAQAGSDLRWGAILVSVIVLALFAAVTMGWAPKPGDGLLQLLFAAVTLVLGFWLGRSARDPATDQALANAIPAHLVSTLGIGR